MKFLSIWTGLSLSIHTLLCFFYIQLLPVASVGRCISMIRYNIFNLRDKGITSENILDFRLELINEIDQMISSSSEIYGQFILLLLIVFLVIYGSGIILYLIYNNIFSDKKKPLKEILLLPFWTIFCMCIHALLSFVYTQLFPVVKSNVKFVEIIDKFISTIQDNTFSNDLMTTFISDFLGEIQQQLPLGELYMEIAIFLLIVFIIIYASGIFIYLYAKKKFTDKEMRGYGERQSKKQP